MFFLVHQDLFCDGPFDRVGPARSGRDDFIIVGLVASEFCLEVGTFLLLGNCPGFLLLADGELLLLPCFLAQAASFLSHPATVGPDMGIELPWLCYDLIAGGGGGECCLSIMLIQEYGVNAGEGQDVSGEDKCELAVHSGSCNKKGGDGIVFFCNDNLS